MKKKRLVEICEFGLGREEVSGCYVYLKFADYLKFAELLVIECLFRKRQIFFDGNKVSLSRNKILKLIKMMDWGLEGSYWVMNSKLRLRTSF